MVHDRNFRFGLSDDSKDRGVCPKCHRRDFTPYKDYETNQLIDKELCGNEYYNSQNKYSNHTNTYNNNSNKNRNYSDRSFGNSLQNNPNFSPNKRNYGIYGGDNRVLNNNPNKLDLEALIERLYDCDYIPNDYIKSKGIDSLEMCSLGNYLLSKKIDREDIIEMYKDMYMRSNTFEQTIYYLTDSTHRIRSAKIMNYDKDGHRIRYSSENKDNSTFIADAFWLHKQYEKELKEVNSRYHFNYKGLPFGLENLLKTIENYGVKETVVWLFEAEKSASIMHLLYKKRYPHLAMIGLGGKGNLSTRMLVSLKELGINSLIAFPDKGCLMDWRENAQKIYYELGMSILVSDKIETSTLEDGKDIIDFVL